MSQADDKAKQLIEYIRCAQINMQNVKQMFPHVFAACPHLRIVEHQIDCAAAIADGQPEPELVP